MNNCGPLFWYGLFLLILTGSLIVIPNLLKNTSLVSGWNMMLVGIASFSGFGCLEAADSEIIRYPGVDWFQPTVDEVTWFMMSSTVFLAALIFTYYYNPFQRVTSRTLTKWPPQSTALSVWVIGACLLVVFLVPLTMGSIFVGKIIMNLSHKAIIFATVFTFLLWMKQKLNPLWIAIFIVTFLAALMLAMMAGATRRLFLSVVLGPVVVVYMTYVRNWRPSRALIAIGLIAVTLLSINFIYNSFRRVGMRASSGKERNLSTLINEARNLDSAWLERLREDTYRMMAQSNVQYALLTQRHVDNGSLDAKPLNTLWFILTYPIPRKIWPDKPQSIGLTLPRDIIGARNVSWGVNVVGHSAYEGGLWAAALYGFLAAVGLRFLDDPFLSQPTNPFLISVFSAAAPHIVGWPRGDIFVMTVEAAECFLFVVMLSIGARAMFGTDKSTQTTAFPGAPLIRQSLAR
jgi:hypothetical protein